MGFLKPFLAAVLVGLCALLAWRTHRYRAMLASPQGWTAEPATPFIADFTVDRAPFNRVLSDLAAKCRKPIRVDWDAFAKSDLHRDTPLTLHLYDLAAADALRAAVEQARLQTRAPVVCHWDGESFRITSVQALHNPARVRTTAYDLLDLEAAAPGALASPDGYRTPTIADRAYSLGHAFEETIDPNSWLDNGGPIGKIKVGDRFMWVTQTPEALEGVRRVMALLRRVHARPIESTPEAWPISDRLDTPNEEGIPR
jgi:hypothetical protein